MDGASGFWRASAYLGKPDKFPGAQSLSDEVIGSCPGVRRQGLSEGFKSVMRELRRSEQHNVQPAASDPPI